MKRSTLFSLTLLSFLLMNLGHTQSLDSAFSTSSTMTDEEAKAAKDFVHQGEKDAAIKKNCEKEGLGNCNIDDVNKQGAVLGQGDFAQAIENNIGKFYGTIMGAMAISGGGKVTVTDKKAAEGKSVKEQKKIGEQKTDYCSYAAMGYEIISAAMQTGAQDKIANETAKIEDLQVRSLVALKKTHEARKKTATYQSAIYGATSACYITRATGVLDGGAKVALDWQYWAKMSAATALTTLYIAKAVKHKNAAKAVQAVIDGLPKTGDCNPWTDTKCFCSAASSKELYAQEYQEICVLNNGNAEIPKVAMGCGELVNGKMTYDKECKCKQTNTCFKANVKATNPKFQLAGNFMNQANKGFDLLSSGDFDQGQFDSYALQAGVNASRLKDKIAPIGQPKIPLDAKEKEIAQDLLESGIPATAAAAIANSPMASPPGGFANDGTQAALDKLPDNLKSKIGSTEPIKYSKGGPGFGTTSADEEEGFVMPTFGQEKKAESGTEILSFAEQAVNQADVTHTPETPIFDIISNRYKRSGWTKLQPADTK